jgi:hypothetical protein
MRFVDGDLPPNEWSDVAAEAARNPSLAQQIEAFRFTKEELSGAFAPALQVPPALVENILRRGAPAPRKNRWRPSLIAPSSLNKPNARLQVMATAAMLALLIAGAAGWVLRDSVRPDYSGLVAPPSLQVALEETPSNASAKLSDNMKITPIYTFASIQKSWCREYKLFNGNRLEATALACRGDDGIWRVEAQEAPRATSPPGDPKAYSPAGNDPGESVAEHRDRIMGADLSLEDEAELIKGRWKRKP